MSKPKVIRADPKVRIHGDYNTGASYIHRGRVALDAHLLEDHAYGIEVSKKAHLLATGVTCITCHEYAQTYLDIYVKAPVVNRIRNISNKAAYFGEYITNYYPYISTSNGVQQITTYGPYHSFCSYKEDGTVHKLSSLYFLPLIGLGAGWDYIGNNLVAIYGNLVTDPLANVSDVLLNTASNSIFAVDVNTCGVVFSKLLGLGAPTAARNLVKIENNKVLFQQYTGSTYQDYTYDFSSQSVAQLPISGLSSPVGGLINSQGNRAVAYLADSYASNGTLFALYPDKNGNNVSYGVASSLFYGSNNIPASYSGGFDANNDFVVVLYNNIQSSTPSNISPYIRVIWNGASYDLTPQSGSYNPAGTSLVKIVPFGNGALIITTEFLIYFAGGVFEAYANILPPTALVVGAVVPGCIDFKNTATKGLVNIFTRTLAGLNTPSFVVSAPNTYPTDTELLYGVKWKPIIPGDWLTYPGIYT